jgi:hypothetical protein
MAGMEHPNHGEYIARSLIDNDMSSDAMPADSWSVFWSLPSQRGKRPKLSNGRGELPFIDAAAELIPSAAP